VRGSATGYVVRWDDGSLIVVPASRLDDARKRGASKKSVRRYRDLFAVRLPRGMDIRSAERCAKGLRVQRHTATRWEEAVTTLNNLYSNQWGKKQ
jgi:hypothetical protein